jgi:5-methylthioadenosine/S-adenosylhomocysteine deaminase
MPAVLADLRIEARWIVPMSTPGQVLENHSMVVRDGRILEVLPTATAAARYAATAVVQRPAHLLMPGLVNSATHAAMPLPFDPRFASPEFVRDGVMSAIAEMLVCGITCFSDRSFFPAQTARTAGEQGMRAVIGLPMAEGFDIRDEYRSHPLVSTAIAPHPPNSLTDAAFARIATLADELDAAIVIDLHESAAEIAESIAAYGLRPIRRLWQLGLLTPALTAVHMVQASSEDIELARRTGISISLCPQSSLRQGFGLAPAKDYAAAGIRIGLGSGRGASLQSHDTWTEMRLLALTTGSGPDSWSAWEVLAAATRGGASVLGLDTEVGTLEAGKWADLCCLDLDSPAVQPLIDPLAQLVFCGGREMVSDVWVAGRQLLSEKVLTRMDWPAVAARANAWAARLNTGG